MNTNTLEILLTTSDLARRHHVSAGGIANARSEGRSPIPYLRLGSAVRYRLSDVLDYEASSVVLAVA